MSKNFRLYFGQIFENIWTTLINGKLAVNDISMDRRRGSSPIGNVNVANNLKRKQSLESPVVFTNQTNDKTQPINLV